MSTYSIMCIFLYIFEFQKDSCQEFHEYGFHFQNLDSNVGNLILSWGQLNVFENTRKCFVKTFNLL